MASLLRCHSGAPYFLWDILRVPRWRTDSDDSANHVEAPPDLFFDSRYVISTTPPTPLYVYRNSERDLLVCTVIHGYWKERYLNIGSDWSPVNQSEARSQTSTTGGVILSSRG